MEASTFPASARTGTVIEALTMPCAVTGGNTVAARYTAGTAAIDSCPQVTVGKLVNTGIESPGAAEALCWPTVVAAGNTVASFSTVASTAALVAGVKATVSDTLPA